MSDEVSKQTVLVLVALTVVVSLLGTYTFLTAVDDYGRDAFTRESGVSQIWIKVKGAAGFDDELPILEPDMEGSQVKIEYRGVE